MFDATVIAAAKAHALAAYPAESVGFVVAGAYEPQVNLAAAPGETFRVEDAAYLDAVARGLEAVLHSHPDGHDHPSRLDMEQQAATGVPWGICTVRNGIVAEPFFWGGRTPVPELVGRVFRHGVTDCYALIRDWYRLERGVALPEYARDHEWWQAGQNLYLENFTDAGFVAYTLPDGAEPAVGDVFLGTVRSPVPNHGGVYIGDGLILHHLQDRLSRREPVYSWRKFITHWLRFREPALQPVAPC